MVPDDDDKSANRRMRAADAARNESPKQLIMRDKLRGISRDPTADSNRSVGQDARHRAWLRQAVRRGR